MSITLFDSGVYVVNGNPAIVDGEVLTREQLPSYLEYIGFKENLEKTGNTDLARRGTIAHQILSKHNVSDGTDQLRLRFDSLASHDITYVGIIQTARASGMEQFRLPYVLTNCHNSLCAVGGTINEDDHRFGLSAAKKYGGIFVPAHLAVIHQYIREMMTGCGKMILGSDSHTRYGALGTMGVGEGGPEIVKQLLGETYDLNAPEVVCVYLEGAPRPGVGPHDIALALIGAVFKKGFVKNRILEFIGPGIDHLTIDFRNGIDVMTTETTCLSSIWRTDETVSNFYAVHGRECDYKPLDPASISYYDGLIWIDLGSVRSMIALPFHPSNVFEIETLKENAGDIFNGIEREAKDLFGDKEVKFSLTGKIHDHGILVDQGIIAGCSGGLFENIFSAADLIGDGTVNNGDCNLLIYPASQPISQALITNGIYEKLIGNGIIMRTAFCGPCFGAGDTPANGALSVRHTTRNFPNREGSKPGDGQVASVALMDARSIAATYRNGGILTAADQDEPKSKKLYAYHFNQGIYQKRVYAGVGQPLPEERLIKGPNIADWPKMEALPKHLLLRIAAVLSDSVTTTDELIPSGETSSYRSNPLRLATFTLSRKDPHYVKRAMAVAERSSELATVESIGDIPSELRRILQSVADVVNVHGELLHFLATIGLHSVICAVKPGDGSAREQAASCQRVLGTCANIANDYATRRYRSNCINWGIIPFTTPKPIFEFPIDGYVFIPEIRAQIKQGQEKYRAWLLGEEETKPLDLYLVDLSEPERKIILAGNLINYQAQKLEKRAA